MGRGKSSGDRVVTCWYCGQKYRRTNWMLRANLGRDGDGRRIIDTHEAACVRKQQAGKARGEG